METIFNPPKEIWDSLCKRPLMETGNIEKPVREIMENVRRRGDAALLDYARQFDRAELTGLKISQTEINDSEKKVSAGLKEAIDIARSNIEKFHRAQFLSEEVVETMPGVRCWRKNVPVETAGLYIPGGSAPLFSTVLMLAIPASIAGCKKIIMCTPPNSDGEADPLILYCAKISGVTEIFRAGGAQAIAAMAYGTETIPAADKIFGPGNQYVTRAKEIVQSEGIAIDMPAGPSEVLVIADRTADPAFVAADLLSQAEHGPDSQVLFLTDDEELLTNVKTEVEKQLQLLPRKSIAGYSLMNSLAILMNDIVSCIDFSNLYAPEHLIINAEDAGRLAERVVNAGSVFIGNYSCESAGDYASGTNHTLPTNGFARTFSGLSVDSFVKKITFQEISRQGILNLGPAVGIMAEAEKLEGHKNAVTIRLKYAGNV
ncbi:MAG: histidinol dehydrogenase [Bacteroidales bacterium]|nr:histidinol dehydrogenase [Bacteroidales bacterium]MBN2633429.1 histidinol dehydrogenase [Bacteroidales bacterium]